MTNDDCVHLIGIAGSDEPLEGKQIPPSELIHLEAVAHHTGLSINIQYAYKSDNANDDGIYTDARCLATWFVPSVVYDALVAIASSGATVGVMQLLKTWVDARNGRKLKIKIGDIEVEATQMSEKDVLRIFELLQEKADRNKIRDVLLQAPRE